MPAVTTEGIVLHAFDYSETSRILRLATRDAGVLSVIARGARRPRGGFGGGGCALDLFSHGMAQLALKEGRDLQTLASFEVVRSRYEIAGDMGRFAGASVMAELMIRFGTDDPNPMLFASLADALDRMLLSSADAAQEAGLAGAWLIVSELGFAPSLEGCSACHRTVSSGAAASFSHEAGGVLCEQCSRHHHCTHTLPAGARACISEWVAGRRVPVLGSREARAHKRLLREFVERHLSDGSELRAFSAWENVAWSQAVL